MHSGAKGISHTTSNHTMFEESTYNPDHFQGLLIVCQEWLWCDPYLAPFRTALLRDQKLDLYVTAGLYLCSRTQTEAACATCEALHITLSI